MVGLQPTKIFSYFLQNTLDIILRDFCLTVEEATKNKIQSVSHVLYSEMFKCIGSFMTGCWLPVAMLDIRYKRRWRKREMGKRTGRPHAFCSLVVNPAPIHSSSCH